MLRYEIYNRMAPDFMPMPDFFPASSTDHIQSQMLLLWLGRCQASVLQVGYSYTYTAVTLRTIILTIRVFSEMKSLRSQEIFLRLSAQVRFRATKTDKASSTYVRAKSHELT